MHFKAAKRGFRGGPSIEAAWEVMPYKVAVFLEAANILAKAIAETIGRAVGQGVIELLRRHAELAAGSAVLMGEEEEQAGEQAQGEGEERAEARRRSSENERDGKGAGGAADGAGRTEKAEKEAGDQAWAKGCGGGGAEGKA